MNGIDANVAMQFDDAEQQRSAATLGMWVFLTTEVLFFGGMFVAYVVYRYEFPEVFQVASQHVNLWTGGFMTAILLTGSLQVALSDHLIERSDDKEAIDPNGMRREIVRRLAITAFLGLVFLGLEINEYFSLIHERLLPGPHFDRSQFMQLGFAGGAAQLFFVLFFCMTGLHGLHMIIGVSLVSGIAVAFQRSLHPERLRNALMVTGLYWHFVDIVWLFLYPLFYLVR